MKIESQIVEVHASAEKVFDYVSDMRNFVHLLPQDKISDWKATEKECSFKIQGAAVISFKHKELHRPYKIILEAGEKSPFPFVMELNFDELENDKIKAQTIFDAEVNNFLKMMIQKPLTKLFDHIAEKIVEVKF